MAFWANIAAEHQPAYQRWHNAEHIPERLSITGFVRGFRYRSVQDDTRFLMYYETEGPEVLTSEAYLGALNRPTERTRAALKWFRSPMRNVYTLSATWGHRRGPRHRSSWPHDLPDGPPGPTGWNHQCHSRYRRRFTTAARGDFESTGSTRPDPRCARAKPRCTARAAD